jgi:hypothetical protein
MRKLSSATWQQLNGVGCNAEIVFFSKLVFATQKQGNRESFAA